MSGALTSLRKVKVTRMTVEEEGDVQHQYSKVDKALVMCAIHRDPIRRFGTQEKHGQRRILAPCFDL